MEKLQKQDARYARSLIEASLDPLITISTEGKIMDMNEALCTITAEPREKLIGTDFGNYFTDPEKARQVYKEVFAKGFVANYPLTIIDGELTDVLFNGSVYKDEKGKVLGAVVVARVITEQKRFEKELLEAKEIAETAKKKAEDSAQAKQQFLSNMSHEIRTPLNAVIGFTKILFKTDLTEKQKEYLTAINTSGTALMVLINDILDLAKVDAGKMTFEHIPFRMSASISAMLHLFKAKVDEKNLDLIKEYDREIPDVLVGDPVRLNQIILNLVSNAVKFTTKGKVIVSVHLLSEDEDKVMIEFAVKDSGIGIEEDKLGTIFENFKQATTGTSRLYGGTGLGLAIMKQLVEQQGGSVKVTSVINEGSIFSFIMSFKKTNSPAVFVPESQEPDRAIKTVKVLVAEDIVLNQLLMKTLLNDYGFEWDIAGDGKIAIEKLQSNYYDIILMDLQMPEMNGFEATEYIRNKMNSKIPIIALTADVTTVDLAKCMAVGMNDYISKPVDERVLYTKITGLVKQQLIIKSSESETGDGREETLKYVDLSYLTQRTKSDPKLMMEMISTYLEQTPPLIKAMKESLQNKDWNTLQGAVHKMIPSFSIMGISKDFENLAKKVQESANNIQHQAERIPDMVMQLEKICNQACNELEEEFNKIKKTIHEK